jgi:hypothetical protein
MRIALLLTVTLFTGCEPSGTAAKSTASSPADVKALAANYRTLRSMTKEPVEVDADLAMMCRGIEQRDVEAQRKIAGPHAMTAVSIFMNASAAETFGSAVPNYPLGSVIVKEKVARYANVTKGHDGVGGMIKRAAGFDPENGDWEYFYFEDANRIESGSLRSCVDCHSGASKTDHVFGSWARGD